MTDTREKLIGFLNEIQDSGVVETPAGSGFKKHWIENERIADYLIANGVTISSEIEELKADNERLRNMWAEAVSKASKADAKITKWIPVTERLPENFISVLVHIPEMNPCPAVMEAYRFDDGWVTKMAAFDINCATHWMPLPEAPKGE